MDICYKIVDAVKKELKLDKLEVKLNPVTSSTRIPLLANGTDRSRMRLDHQQRRAPEADRLHQHPLPDREPLRLEEIQQDQLDRRSQGQVGGLDLRHHQHQAAHRGQCRAQPRRQHHPGQGSCRGLPDGRDRSRGGLRDGRHPAREPGRRIEGAGRLRHLQGRVLEAGALRHHAAQGRSGLQEGGRCRHRRALPERRGHQDLREMVHGRRFRRRG